MATYFEKLTAKQQAELKKCSDDRLRARLVKTGVEEELVVSLDRTRLLESMAEQLVKGETAVAGGKPMSIWEKELALREKELWLRQEEREIEEKRRQEEKEAAERRLEIDEREDEAKRRQEEKERWEADKKMREIEFERQKRIEHDKKVQENSLTSRTKKQFAEAIKHVLPRMPPESAELPGFFDNIENLFALYEVPSDLRSK
jgi:hypothetical protein